MTWSRNVYGLRNRRSREARTLKAVADGATERPAIARAVARGAIERPGIARPVTVVAVATALAVLLAAGPAAADDGADADPYTRPGRWRQAVDLPEGQELTETQKREIERLRSIGYIGGVNYAPAETGVTTHDPARAYGGLNFYASGHFPGAVLMDMDGNILHTWRFTFDQAWPEREWPEVRDRAERWRRAHLFENGDVLAIFEGQGLIKIDRDSQLIWEYSGGAHHDFEVTSDGRIYVLTREPHIVPWVHATRPILEDFVTVLDSRGNELQHVSIVRAFEGTPYRRAPKALGMRAAGDVTHTNTVEVLDGSLADRLPSFAAGSVLVSIRNIDTIAVIDMEAGRVRWLFAGPWLEQHQPTVLENGNILVFDNGGDLASSRVVEFDPLTQETVWVYEGDPPDLFYSKTCGSNLRLPNGNTLITESDNGRAFEVTRGGETVWEYWNPQRAGLEDEYIATIFEMIRLEPDFPLDWLPSE
jgi:hypothetical protein